ncbi:MAG: alginate lyase family protein [Bacteroidales bacterium]|nr:alginate lyase family protein [Bacteroidales bacterium]
MFTRIRRYLSTYEMFVQLQYGLRRRFLECHYRIFRKLIVHNINQYSYKRISNDQFINNLSSVLKIPKSIIANENEKLLIIKSADKTLKGVYNLLGSGDVEINPINWHIDFKVGFEWKPGMFFRNYKQEDINSPSDVKIPRELSRGHHLLKLGLAYKLTNDEKYAESSIDQIKNWINENPLMYSINWGCTMDVAIRAVNWIYTLCLISNSKLLDDKTINKIKSSLYQHGWFIYRNPERDKSNNGNHYLADLAGQISLGLLFKNLEEPKRWLQLGKEELFREIRMEILPSGMTYERSTNYNRMVLELIMVPVLLLRENNHEIPTDIWYRLEKMFDFIMFSLKPDGTTPIIGDQDNGRLLPFNQQETIDFRYLLSLGAVLFNRADLKYHGDGFNIFCSIFGGPEVREKWGNIPVEPFALGSCAFRDVGLYVMRNKDNYLIFNATGRGLYPELSPGSHTHSDLLSFELFTQGKSFIIDPGSYLYTADADQRLLFRSTKMHNTVTVDGESQEILCRDKMWGNDRTAIPEILKWESNSNRDIIRACHNGYTRLLEPVIHERRIIFDKENEKWMIKDALNGNGRHTCEWYFHLDHGIDFEINEYVVNTTCKDGKNICLIFKSESEVVLKKELSFISKSYGIKEEGNVLVAKIVAQTPIELTIEVLKNS